MKNPFRSPRIDVIIPLLLLLLGGAALLIARSRGMVLKDLVAPAMTCLVAVFATASAASFSHRSDRRAVIANSFEIARRWDEKTYLECRETTRGKKRGELIKKLAENDPDTEKAFIHYTNLFWEMAIAIGSGLADERYLRERFHLTLEEFYPCFEVMLNSSVDRGAADALAAIRKLHLRWSTS